MALGITASLAAIAWPGYRQLLHRSQRMEATLALLRVQYLQERFYADHHAYTGRLQADGADGSLPIATITEGGNYVLSVNVGDGGQDFIATARARAAGRQAGDAHCQHFSIDAVGTRRSAAASGAWRAEPRAGCWR